MTQQPDQPDRSAPIDSVLAAVQADLPGWHVWYTTGSTVGWYAVPAPADTPHDEALFLPNQLGPVATPQALLALAQERYGWDDYCKTCAVLARECGHRQDETPDR